MKNKKTIYVLIPAVLLVWALIFYRVSEGIQVENNSYTNLSATFSSRSSTTPDTFQYALQLNYPDPFLGNRHSIRQASAVSSLPTEVQMPPPATKPLQQAEQFNYARFRYVGLVEHKGKKDQLALIVADEKSLMLRKGETAEGIQLLKIHKDSVEIKSGNHRFYLRR